MIGAAVLWCNAFLVSVLCLGRELIFYSGGNGAEGGVRTVGDGGGGDGGGGDGG
jgi:hypothetical protein